MKKFIALSVLALALTGCAAKEEEVAAPAAEAAPAVEAPAVEEAPAADAAAPAEAPAEAPAAE